MILQNVNILITAGPTQEPIDPVRFIGNHSSGKMGYEITRALIKKGANVTLVSGPTNQQIPQGVKLIKVKTADEMYQACLKEFNTSEITILSAAVADYTPKYVAPEKIKKKEETFSIELIKTKDIAKELGQRKSNDQVMVGFALETNNEIKNAKSKLKSKNLDFIVLNSMKNKGTCFGSDHNKISIIDHNNITDFELKPKKQVASDIVNFLSSYTKP